MRIIGGTLKGRPINPPAGCPFAGRCLKATERCRKEMPQPIQVGNRLVACLLYEK